MELQSNCCGADEWLDNTGICGDCKEHADFVTSADEFAQDIIWEITSSGAGKIDDVEKVKEIIESMLENYGLEL